MKKLFADSYLKTQERLEDWFDDLREKAGCGPNADTGAVLRAVEAMSRKLQAYEEQQTTVARSRGYRYWGDYYNAIMKEVPEAVPIELPTAYNEVPAAWVTGQSRMTLRKAEKRLLETYKVIRKVLAYILDYEPDEGKEWAEEMRNELYDRFSKSTDPDAFEKECLELTYEIEEDDPETTWVDAVEWARGALEKASDLPLLAVEELLTYAEDEGVEITKQQLDFIVSSDYAAYRWFDYLLTNYLRKTNRATTEEVKAITELKQEALDLWKCYEVVSACDPSRPTLTKRVYAPSVSVAMIDAACKEVYRLKEEGDGVMTDAWVDAVVEAVASVNDGNALVIAEKNR